MTAKKYKNTADDFPIVCVGGSAGSLQSFISFLHNMPDDLGVAIVIINHLRKDYNLLQEILPFYTLMPVVLITERLCLQPNHVYVKSGNRDLHILNGEFRLKPVSKPWGWQNVITIFLRSLTHNWYGKLIAVIVSGAGGGDGAEALHGIKEVGGITFAQKPDTSAHPDMPNSAVTSGYVDFILSPEDIAKEIIRIVQVT